MTRLIRRTDDYSPMWSLSNLHQDIDSLFGGLWRGTNGEPSFNFSPSCDIEETDTHYQVSFDLAGVKKEDIHLEVKEHELIVSGEKKEERKTTEGKKHLSERFYGNFRRVFTLPTQVNSERVEAVFKDGVLHVSVPKAEAIKSKKISIS